MPIEIQHAAMPAMTGIASYTGGRNRATGRREAFYSNVLRDKQQQWFAAMRDQQRMAYESREAMKDRIARAYLDELRGDRQYQMFQEQQAGDRAMAEFHEDEARRRALAGLRARNQRQPDPFAFDPNTPPPGIPDDNTGAPLPQEEPPQFGPNALPQPAGPDHVGEGDTEASAGGVGNDFGLGAPSRMPPRMPTAPGSRRGPGIPNHWIPRDAENSRTIDAQREANARASRLGKEPPYPAADLGYLDPSTIPGRFRAPRRVPSGYHPPGYRPPQTQRSF